LAAPQEALRHSLQTESEEVLQKQRQEAEEQLLRAEREQEELREEARSLQRDRDLSLLQAESEKQQVRTRGTPALLCEHYRVILLYHQVIWAGQYIDIISIS